MVSNAFVIQYTQTYGLQQHRGGSPNNVIHLEGSPSKPTEKHLINSIQMGPFLNNYLIKHPTFPLEILQTLVTNPQLYFSSS